MASLNKIPEDLKELLDPLKIRKRVTPILDMPWLVQSLLRLLSELLKATHEMELAVKETNRELRLLRQDVSAFRKELMQVLGGGYEGEGSAGQDSGEGDEEG
jgi:hypothetical protein